MSKQSVIKEALGFIVADCISFVTLHVCYSVCSVFYCFGKFEVWSFMTLGLHGLKAEVMESWLGS